LDISDDSEQIVLVWDASSLLDVELKEKENVYCCDRNVLHQLYSKMLLAIVCKYNGTEKLNEVKIKSKQNYLYFKEKTKQKNYSLVCGMGPSLKNNEEKIKTILSDCVTFVCNDYYRVETDIIPDAYVLQDRDYLESEKDSLISIIKYVIKNRIYLFVAESWVSVIEEQYPEISPLIIGLKPMVEGIYIISEEQLKYRNYTNVVPAMVLPVASGIKDVVYIIGCDGRNNETWEHSDGRIAVWTDDNPETKKFLKMDNIESFSEYDDVVNRMYREFMCYAENKGISFVSLVHSNFSEIDKRYGGI
jgi:hypothetical protein